jgi:hypothetical protein
MSTNNYRLTFEDRDTYLYAHLMGEDSFAASLSYWNEIADKVKALDCRKLLIHEDLTGKVVESEMHEIIMDLMPSGLLDVQIAFFDENLNGASMNALGQSLAVNKGANVKIFDSLNAAQDWITQDG